MDCQENRVNTNTIFEFAVLKFKGFMKKISTLIEVKVFVVYNEFGFPQVAVRICT